MGSVTVVWRRELGVLVNWTNLLDGEIVNAAWAVAQMAARPRTSRRAAADLDTAAWADTERLIRDALAGIAADPRVPDLPDLPAAEAAELETVLRGPEVQGAVQALLAVRLTDAAESDASRAREAVRLAISAPPINSRKSRRVNPTSGVIPGSSIDFADQRAKRRAEVATRWSEYLDERIGALVAALEGQVGFAGLAQVRDEAYSARIVALLGAIERQVAALADPARSAQAEAEFLERYRRQAHQRHGFLTPPDFDRRRRVPVADIYVPTGIKEDYPERVALTVEADNGSLTVWDLVGRLGRTVLLGDPGGGKTTAANVITDHFARDGGGRVPFLVTLREYAAKTPIEWSVAGYVGQNLRAVYQSPAPDGLVERLLLTGRAVLLFDGLDELLDTSRRRDVSERVEQFCSAYPLTPVLVTSRVVGYDQARLDDTQFTCYRLGGFGEAEVAEYARKWFTSQDGMAAAEAEAKAKAFLAESGHATDLRGNPLLLSLMCILYRGAGSLPGDRAGIYARCAELLLRKWDEQRDLYRKLGSDHLVEPTLRYLAWWLFTREDSQAVATERELTGKTGEFLYGRGYETEEAAGAAARDFVEFCHGRMWVFSDAGTTADGEKLYGFTHRTFLEYFTAWHLAVTSESPEDLARALLPRISESNGWEIVGELAVRLKSDAVDQGADRVCAVLLDQPQKRNVLPFLVKCTVSGRPTPMTTRRVARAVLDYTFSGSADPISDFQGREGGQLLELLISCGTSDALLAVDELTSRVATLIASEVRRERTDALQLVLETSWITAGLPDNWTRDQIARYSSEIAAESAQNTLLRRTALALEVISIDQVLAMPEGFSTLAEDFPLRFSHGLHQSYLAALCGPRRRSAPDTSRPMTAIGRYITAHPQLPWARARRYWSVLNRADFPNVPRPTDLSGLGAAVAYAVTVECGGAGRKTRKDPSWLPLPAEFKEQFLDWAAGRVDFVEVIDR